MNSEKILFNPYKIAFYLLIAFLVSDCKSSKNTTANDPPVAQIQQATPSAAHEEAVDEADESKPPQNKKYRLIISFYSIGEGSDYKAAKSLQEFLADYAAGSGKTIGYDSFPWGREGEVDFCFPLTELSADEQNRFINDVKKKLEFSKLIEYSENDFCRHIRQ